MEHHSLCGMHIDANLIHFLLIILLRLVVLVIFQVVAFFIFLLLVMHPFQCYQGHMYPGFETIKVWWCKQPYLLTLQQLYYCRSVGKRIRGSGFGLSRRPGRECFNVMAPRCDEYFLYKCPLKFFCIHLYKLYYCKLNIL